MDFPAPDMSTHTSPVEAEFVDFDVHDFRQALQHVTVGHVDLVQEDPVALIVTFEFGGLL